MTQATRRTGLSVLGITTLLLLSASFFLYKTIQTPSFVVLLVTGVQSMAAFWGLAWALPKSDKAFFSIFVGDALLRLAGLGLATYWLWSRHLPYTGALVLLGFAYLAFSVVQIPFFNRGANVR